MFKIDIHTHIIPNNLNEIISTFNDKRFLSIKFVDDYNAVLIKDDQDFRKISCNCWHPQKRISEFSNTGVDIQILSTIPVLFSYWAKDDEGLKLSEFLNNHIYDVVLNNEKHFIGLGTIPMQNVDLAIKEMDRCINELNFPGIQIGSNVNGENLSEKKFDPIFKHAEKINCSIFVHPWEMMGTSDMKKYWLPWLVGMPAETALSICSLIFGGVFEKLPKLRIAFAHGGGAFPSIIGRLEHGFNVRPDIVATHNKHNPRDYIGKFYLDSLVHEPSVLQYMIDLFGANCIALGSDYPFPLGEANPGKMIKNMKLEKDIVRSLYSNTALKWLNLRRKDYKN